MDDIPGTLVAPYLEPLVLAVTVHTVSATQPDLGHSGGWAWVLFLVCTLCHCPGHPGLPLSKSKSGP